MTYTKKMAQENRQDKRFEEIGRVMATELCPISGVLDDISAAGCKVHYSFPVVVDLDNEYDIKISPLHYSDSEPLHLMCKPQWVKETEGSTFIGFKVLYSPDGVRLQKFVQHLEEISKDQLPDID